MADPMPASVVLYYTTNRKSILELGAALLAKEHWFDARVIDVGKTYAIMFNASFPIPPKLRKAFHLPAPTTQRKQK